MVHLIDKSALVAEIEKKRDAALTRQRNLEAIGQVTVLNELIANELNRIITFIDTLEVKEDNLLTEKQNEKVLAEIYINTFDKKFGDKLPNLKSKQLADFKNFINTCEQAFHMKYFDIHATQGKLFEKLALLWAVWGKEHLTFEVKEVNFEKEVEKYLLTNAAFLIGEDSKLVVHHIAKHFFELGVAASNKAQKRE